MAKSVDAQTRVRSKFPAMLAGLPAAMLFFLLELWILFVLFPVAGWSPASDSPVTLEFSLLEIIYKYVNHNVVSPTSIGDYAIFIPYWVKLFLSSFAYYQILLPVLIRLGASVFIGLKCGGLIYDKIYRKTLAVPAVDHVRGPRPLYGAAGVSHLNQIWRDRREGQDTSLGIGIQIAPGVVMPVGIETEHILLCGKPGGGKSWILEFLVWQALKRGDRVWMLDVKGNLLRRIRKRFKNLKPYSIGLAGPELSAWDVGADIKTRSDAAELAAILIEETRDPIWSDGARLILVGIIGGLIKEYGANWGWRHVHKNLGLPLEEIEEQLKHVPEIMQLLRRNGKDPSNALLSLLMTLIANVAELAATLRGIEIKSKKRFSIRKWAEKKMGNDPVIMRHDQSRPEQSKAFARLIVAITSRAILSDNVKDETDHKIWIFADELPRLGRIDLDDLAALGRSRGCRLVASIQSVAQLRQAGGSDYADAFVENFGLRIVCQLSSGEAAKTISERWIGDRLVSSPSQGEGKSAAISAPVIEPSDLVGSFGLNFSVYGRPFIRAAILGVGDVPILDWAIRS